MVLQKIEENEIMILEKIDFLLIYL